MAGCQCWVNYDWAGRSIAYIIPDGHNQDHGDAESFVERAEAADLLEAIAVVKGNGGGAAELRGEGAGVAGDAVDSGRGDFDLLAVLDEELGELVVLEAGDDAAFG